MYLLATDTLVFYLRGREDVRRRLLAVPSPELFTSSVCIGELYYGAAKSQLKSQLKSELKSERPTDRKTEVNRLRDALQVIPLGSVETERFGELKASLERRGERLADADLMIAATALTHNLIAVTHNLRHFGRIDGLQVESWAER